MKGRIVVFSIIMLSVLVFSASMANAACPAGITEVTIVNPAGKVKTISVCQSAVGSIGGPGDIVIPAACPCWSSESIDAHLRVLQFVSCGRANVENGVEAYIYDDQDPVGYFEATVSWWSYGTGEYSRCAFFDAVNDINNIYIEDVSYDEARACTEILMNSDMWELNCSVFYP